MDNALIQIGVQVPALLIVSYVLLNVTRMIMDVQGRKLDDLTKAVEKLIDEIRLTRRAR